MTPKKKKTKRSAKYSRLIIKASTTDRVGSKLLYQYLVEQAKEKGVSGATVFRGIMGYGTSSKIHSSRFWELTEKLPVVIEFVDKTEKLEQFYAEIEEELLNMPKGCLVTLEDTEVLLQKKGK
jgi:PII-like signaling protein